MNSTQPSKSDAKSESSENLATPDQQRAKHAWQVVAKVLENHPPKIENGKKIPAEKAKKFGGQARKMPVRVMASGLGQALAFLKAKGYAPELLIALGDWVLNRPEDGFDRKPANRPTDDALLKSVINGSSDYLRQATLETLAYLAWLNRFCEAHGLTEESNTENG